MPETLSVTEQTELARQEAVIERGLTTFVEVGEALLQIRDSRLYRAQYDTFEAYCNERWQIQKSQAYRLIDAAKVAGNLSPIGEVPQNEAQARPLASLTPDDQRLAWQKAIETAPDGKITGAHVAAVAEQYKAPVEESTHNTAISAVAANATTASDATDSTPEAPRKNGALFTSETHEWYTPAHIIERVKRLMGAIDLDPCSTDKANETVGADFFFTKAENGLSQAWHMPDGSGARLYMNPPYGTDIGLWVNKLADEYEAGHIEEAITLLPARTDTAWIRRLARWPRCFVWGRLKFSESDNSATFPSVLIYLGPQETLFARIFQGIGDIYVQWRPDEAIPF